MTIISNPVAKINPHLILPIALMLGNLSLLAPAGSLPRVIGAMILLLLPGLAWTALLIRDDDFLTRSVVGLGLSYALLVIAGLLLHYLPGAISTAMVVTVLNGLALVPLLMGWFRGKPASEKLTGRANHPWVLLLAILLLAAFFRFYSLGYSEFTGDEIKPLISAAEALEGNEEAIFINRKKGPGEIMVPMVQWRLVGVINEATARTPFALVGVLSVLTMYLVANRLWNQPIGLIAALLLALNGFMVGFARILQYQSVVVWMSLLALLSVWQWRHTNRFRWLAFTGIFLAVGVLFHYDTILVAPALAYVIVTGPNFNRRAILPLTGAAVIAAGIVALFLIPFAANPQASFTANYVGGRIGQSLIKNNLFDFFHYTIFYDSFYYVAFTGALLLAFLAWTIRRFFAPRLAYLFIAILTAAVLFLSVKPAAFFLPAINFDLAFLPFALLLFTAWLSPKLDVGQKAVLVWFAVTFLGYNFLVDDPRTHFYTISPAWVMLAAPAAFWLWRRLTAIHVAVPAIITLLLTLLFGGYLYIAFLRQDVELRADWPTSQPALYWSPFTELPRHHFGFVHNVGWKAVGGLYAAGQLDGRFNTNSESGLSRWYARQALWGCPCCEPKTYYFAFHYKDAPANDLTGLNKLGGLTLPVNDFGVDIYQASPPAAPLNPPAVETLYRAFDQAASPAAFALPRGQHYPAQVNLADLFTLTGYTVIAPSPHPGEEIAVTLHWQRTENYQPINFDVFVYLQNAEGGIVGQSTAPPVCGQKLTTAWAEGETVADSHIIKINPDAPPGEYTLFAGMSVPGEDFRLPVFDDAGQSLDDVAKLGQIKIE